MKKQNIRKFISMVMLIIFVIGCLNGCSANDKNKLLDPKNPVTISVWHYYNGTILNAFDNLIQEFNDTVGREKGIIIEGFNYGSVSELEKAVLASANKEVGSQKIPNIFASYADTAYESEKLGILADIGEYLTEKEQQQYLDSYIEEGKIGLNGELRIFPIAKSTETFMLNDTDWKPFAQANNLTYDDLSTLEGLTRVSKLYYEWTDAQTQDVPNDGRAFFGRDSLANMFIIASKEFDTEIFQVKDGKCTLNINETVMKKLWDNYYAPYISGYFSANGKFRSEEVKVGDILAYIGSSVSAVYFPSNVITEGTTYPVDAKVLPAPHFENAKKVMVQQGAGMVVTKSTPKEEAASVEFLKFFTDVDNNSVFSALSGYMPVKKEAAEYDTLISNVHQNGQTIGEIADATLQIALEEIKTSELYTNKAFSGGKAAREVLDNHLHEKALSDREAVIQLLNSGTSHETAIAQFITEENFKAWLEDFTMKLQEVIE